MLRRRQKGHVVADEPEKTQEELHQQAAALLGPGSVGEVVRNFKKSLKARNYGDAAEFLDENLLEFDLTGLDLTFLDEPGWGVSGRPRVVGPDSEIVLYIRSAKGALQRVDKAKPVEAFPFTVRRTADGMRISQIGGDGWLNRVLGY
jgi:hypothetical protein